MICPKCGHEQAENSQCEACGVIFEKYQRYLEMREQGKVPASNANTVSGRRGGFLLWGGLVGAAALIVAGFLLVGENPTSQQPTTVTTPATVEQPAASSDVIEDSFDGLDLVAQLQGYA